MRLDSIQKISPIEEMADDEQDIDTIREMILPTGPSFAAVWNNAEDAVYGAIEACQISCIDRK